MVLFEKKIDFIFTWIVSLNVNLIQNYWFKRIQRFSFLIWIIKCVAWQVIQNSGRTAIDAIVEGCAVCEREQCDGTVGYGGSPDENSNVALDALLVDGSVYGYKNFCILN